MERIVFYVICLNCFVNLGHAEKKERISMKIVEDVSYYGQGLGNSHLTDHNAESGLTLRIKPSNFSGPPHLKRLLGKCFSKVDDSYKYEVCPFHNVTQHEQSLRWNPYSGVLGVWQDWDIHNNTFTALNLAEGDSCGNIFRSAQVILRCGNETKVGNVTEPRTCHYRIILDTPLVCHPHSLLVYPTLSEAQRKKWDMIEDEFVNGILTQQGYDNSLRRFFEEVGYQLPSKVKTELAEEAKNKERREENGEFVSLQECSAEYKKLKSEVEGLRALVDVHRMDDKKEGGNNDVNPYPDHFAHLDYDD